MYIAARAGPMELPIIRIRLAMPSDIPLFCLGVFRTIVFWAPMAVNDIPMAIIPRLVDMRNSVEWNKKRWH
jgi:hypothetical protein